MPDSPQPQTELSLPPKFEPFIAEMKAELQKRTQELEARNAELAQFAFIASHDLRAPLRTIEGFAALLVERLQGVNAEVDSYLGEICAGVERMDQLISDLLSYTQASSQDLTIMSTDLNHIVNLVLKDLQLDIEEADAEISVDPLPTIEADPLQMRQLFQNLLSNALKFRSQEPLRIQIGLQKTTARHLFFVKDNGIGIDPAHHERIFDMFQRLHSQEAYAGTGIGLAICKKIVERHHGRIDVRSELGTGATFLFSLL